MIMMESLGRILPTPDSGKIVGVASYRGDYIIVACEYGLFRLWEDDHKNWRYDAMPPPEASEKT